MLKKSFVAGCSKTTVDGAKKAQGRSVAESVWHTHLPAAHGLAQAGGFELFEATPPAGIFQQPDKALHCLRDILSKSSAYLEHKKIDSPRLSAELVVAHALGTDRLALYLNLDRPLSGQELSSIRPLLARRATGEPIAYILGRKEFYGLDFFVSKDVLIPRPETELGVDLGRGLFSPERPLLFADVATGSGVLAVALLVHFPMARCLATDISRPAMGVAQANLKAHGVDGRALLTQADLLSHLGARSLDLLVANLPYLSEAEISSISTEVACFEPRTALVGGPRGDELFAPLLDQAMTILKAGAYVLLETGYSQAEALAEKIQSLSIHWSGVKVVKDFGGLNRYVQAQWLPMEKKNNTAA